MREPHRRPAGHRKTRTGEIMRGKRISHLKKQKWGVRVYRFRNSDKHHSIN